MSKRVILIALLLTASLGYSQMEPAEVIVQKQIKAYNNRDLEAFLSFYADDAKIFYFPQRLNLDGKAALRNAYDPYFKKAKEINCKINNRIIRGNTIIDEEYVTYDGIESSAVVIYEIDNYGKIARVTFLD